MTRTGRETGEGFEFTGLLQDFLRDDVQSPSFPPETHNAAHHSRKWRVILLLYAFSFFMMLGDYLYPAALIQVMEDVICNDYYNTPSGADALVGLQITDRCKTQAVQKELAFVRGVHQLVPVFAGVLCTVPYGLLADRIGRRPVLMLSGAGMAFGFAWVLAICYWQFAPLRWVWLSGAFLFIGGGDPVLSSVSYVMITDVTERSERTQIFLCLHAADVVSGFFGPAISAALMETGHIWSVLLLSGAASFFGAFIITALIPETLHLSHTAVANSQPPSSSASAQDTGSESAASVEAIKPHAGLLAPLHSVLTSNPQAVLLLCIYAPQTAARELFNTVGLQYSNVKFNLSYGRGNVLLSLFQGAQGLLALVLLPFITRVIADPRGWTALVRDRLYAIVSIGATTAGLLVIAWAPAISIVVVGLLVVSLGSCTNGLLMSLMGGAVRSDQVSAVYSAALMLNILMRSLAAPIFNGLLVEGMELGWKWLGLPFVVMAVVMACEFIASWFVRAGKEGIIDEE
ncbi:MFS general substrate transporter [Xylariaceae sp. AK1471]|nr:MFS general substrate transporter [Xylariaceae sp. AK1471]